ncbi:hypothetical protein EVAR_90728_1 [Eumeta japonica]|uniref:Uncharacterized protein n=1 Tax=Eumeta variegata TaxID=151549 RepID=A0A4C2A537_EUMVA|nr:hypothetical protein EVAR_90728_1 [Eumeta japonica]
MKCVYEADSTFPPLSWSSRAPARRGAFTLIIKLLDSAVNGGEILAPRGGGRARRPAASAPLIYRSPDKSFYNSRRLNFLCDRRSRPARSLF